MRVHQVARNSCHARLRLGIGIAFVVSVFIILTAAPGNGSDLEPVPYPAEAGAGGEGYHLGNTGLWLGGYLNIDGVVPKSGPASLGLADAGLLARYELTPRVTLFNETDLEDSVTLQEGAGLQRGSQVLLLERLYADWSVTPNLTVRTGKFLTPFGLWNVIRRAPLTWTVERPLATQSVFPEHVTGLGLIYETTRQGWTLDASAYGQPSDELVPGSTDTTASGMAGGRIAAAHTLGAAYVGTGISSVAFKNSSTGLWEYTEGCDLDVTLWGNQLMAEFAYDRLRQNSPPHEWGLYLQDALPLYGSLYGVLRFEHFEPRQGPVVNGALLGLAWHASPHIFLKADYQFADQPDSDLERGFFAALVLFF